MVVSHNRVYKRAQKYFTANIDFTCIFKHSHVPWLQIPETLIQYTGTNFCLSRFRHLTGTKNLRLVFFANNAPRIRSLLRQLSSGGYRLNGGSQLGMGVWVWGLSYAVGDYSLIRDVIPCARLIV